MHDRSSYWQKVVLGLAAAVLMGGVGVLGIKASLGAYADSYSIIARFSRTGQGVDTTATVKIRGVTVGKVTNIKLLPDGSVDIRLDIDDGIEIPDTVVATAEPLSVFGPKFIRLDPGAHEKTGPYLRDGDRIKNTSPPTELTDILSRTSRLLDVVDPDELATVIHTLADGVEGLGPQLGQTIDDAGVIVDILDEHRADARAFLTDLAALASELAEHGDELAAGLADIDPALASLADHEDELGDLLDATSSITGDLADVLQREARSVDALLRGLSPTVDALYDQLGVIPEFLQANDTLIETLGTNLLRYELPGGHIAAVLKGGVALDACEIFIGAPSCENG